uniref:B box-type domain-containing protein n=3 Tax=Esox lucius TaxID=8010 RepID=A0A3P8XRY3_ESOLU
MNLNDFVVIPKNPKSVKLNARNLRELRLETVTLVEESKDMEDRLRQLRESMGREKEERGRSGRFRWKSGQPGALTNHGAKRNKENGLGKSAGKLKIRILQDGPGPELRGALEKDKAPAPLPGGEVSCRKSRLRGKVCGQCEARNAGLMCAECGEDYCVGSFAKFHQKGALKLHRMIPIQTEIQTSVSTLDVVSHFQRQVHRSPNPDSHATGKGVLRGLEGGTQAIPAVVKFHNAHGSQVLFVNHSGAQDELDEQDYDDDLENEEVVEMLTPSLLVGEYDEEASTWSFQEALRQWRGDRKDGGKQREEGVSREGGSREPILERGDTIWRPHQARPVETMGTQADLSDAGDERGPVKVEFTQFSVSYLERLLLKRHRRTPIEAYQPLASLASPQTSPTPWPPPEETTNTLTAEDEEFRRYCASLFAVSSCGCSAEPKPSSGSCLSIKELDKTVRESGFVAEPKAEDNTKHVRVHVSGGPKLSHNALDQEAMLPRPPLLSKTETTQLPQPDCSTVRSPRFTNRSRQLKASKAQRTPRMWAETLDASPQSDRSFGVCPSTPDSSSPRPPPSTSDPDLLLGGPSSSISPHPPSPHSLRSTFTLSPRSATETESPMLPKCLGASGYFNPPSPAKGLPDSLSPLSPRSLCAQSLPSPLRSTGFQSPGKQLLSWSDRTPSPPEPLSAASQETHSSSRSRQELCSTSCPSPSPDASSSGSMCSPSQEHARPQNIPLPGYQSPPLSQDAASPRSSLHPLTPCPSPPDPLSSVRVSSQLHKKPISTEPNITHSLTGARSLASSLSPNSPSPISQFPKGDPPLLTESLSHSSGSLRNYSSQESPRLLSGSVVRQSCSPAFSPRISETDFDIESSIDSLGLTPRGEDSSGEKMKIEGCLLEWRSNVEETQVQHLHLDRPPVFLIGCGLEPEAGELVPEPSAALLAVAQKEQIQTGNFCDLEGFLTLGLVNRGSPHLDPRPTHSLPDTEDSSNRAITGAESWRASSSHSGRAEDNLVKTVMMDSQSQPVSSHSYVATPTQRRPFSPRGLCTSGFTGVSVRSTPELSSRPASVVSQPTSCSFSRLLSRAAREILDISAVDQTGCEDPDLEQDIDTRAISSLAEEFRLMATDSGVARVFSSNRGGAGTVEHVRMHGSDRLQTSRVHSDGEEEEIRRDQQSVLSLP